MEILDQTEQYISRPADLLLASEYAATGCVSTYQKYERKGKKRTAFFVVIEVDEAMET